MTAGLSSAIHGGGRGGAFGGPRTISRRRLLQLAALASGVSALALPGCATPTGLPGPGTYNIALNRSLVSLDNKLNQFDAAVTVQRGGASGADPADAGSGLENVLAEAFELTAPTQWTVRLREGSGTPTTPRSRSPDIATALKMYRGTPGGFLATFFPEWPNVVQLDDRTFRMETKSRSRSWIT